MRSALAIGVRLLRPLAAGVIVTLSTASASERPAGSTGGGSAAQGPKIGASQNTDVLRHRDPAGKACLAVSGSARAYTVNPNLFDHLITATNSCAQRIRLQVCYYRTQQCIAMEVPGRERREAVIGTLPSIKDFRYEFRERF